MPDVWAIDGVEVPAAVARAVVYASSGSAEGVVEPEGLKVAPLDVPSTQVRVLPGAALVRNRYAGGSLQTYAVLEQIQQSLPVVATGSAGGRSDLVIVRVTDPEFGSGDAGSSFEIVQGVPASAGAEYAATLGYPAVALARIDIPASTATITDDLITDLRRMALPRERSEVRSINVPGADKYTITSSSGQTWPAAAEDAGIEIDIPEWATVVKIIATWGSVGVPPGNANGTVWVQVAPTVNPNHFLTQAAGYNALNVNDFSRETWLVADTKTMPAALRGTRQKFYPRAAVTAGVPSAQRAYADWGTSFVLHVVFQEVPD